METEMESGREEDLEVEIEPGTESVSHIAVETDRQAWHGQNERQRISQPVNTRGCSYLLTSSGVAVLCFITKSGLWRGWRMIKQRGQALLGELLPRYKLANWGGTSVQTLCCHLLSPCVGLCCWDGRDWCIPLSLPGVFVEFLKKFCWTSGNVFTSSLHECEDEHLKQNMLSTLPRNLLIFFSEYLVCECYIRQKKLFKKALY